MYPVHRASIFSLENVERVYKNNPPAKKKKTRTKIVCGEAKNDHKKLKKENQLNVITTY